MLLRYDQCESQTKIKAFCFTADQFQSTIWDRDHCESLTTSANALIHMDHQTEFTDESFETDDGQWSDLDVIPIDDQILGEPTLYSQSAQNVDGASTAEFE
eukprot:765413_1